MEYWQAFKIISKLRRDLIKTEKHFKNLLYKYLKEANALADS